MDEIHEELEPIFSQACFQPSERVKELLQEAFTILHTSESYQVIARAMDFQGYLDKIINQGVSVSTFIFFTTYIYDQKTYFTRKLLVYLSIMLSKNLLKMLKSN